MTSYRLLTAITLACFYFLSVALPSAAFAQMVGCKDPAATNYNPSALTNDGSCTYATTNYTPPLKVNPLSNTLMETSGLQWDGTYLWTHNDGGGAAAIYRIDTTSNAILQTVNLEGATNVDWEDMSFDGTHFYIGDFGNNNDGGRRDLKIYKFPLSAIPGHVGNPVVTIPSSEITVINFTYSDQPQPAMPTGANNTKFDCEAMVVDGDDIHLFTKDWITKTTTHYVIDGVTAGTYTAANLETLNTEYLVTAASKVPGANIIVLLGYQNTGLADHYMHLLTDFRGGLFFNGNKRKISLPDVITMGQAEGITFRNSTYGYISNEAFSNFITVPQRLRAFHTDSFTPAYVLPTRLKNFKASNRNDKHEISWSFTEPVQRLKVLGSSNGTSFTALKEYPSSIEETFLTQPLAAQSCYRLSWLNADGSSQYSNTLCLKENLKNHLQALSLRGNGELSFTFTGNEQEKYLLRLLNTQGQLLAQSEHVLTPGSNTVRFLQTLPGSNLVLLQAIHKTEQQSMLLQVQ